MKPKQLLVTLAITAAALAMRPSAQASTITWGTDPDSLLFQTSGLVMDNTFTFELGTFGTTFVPTATNYNDWLANWKRLDRATGGPFGNGGFVSGNGTVSGITGVGDGADSFDHTDNITTSPFGDSSATFAAGERAYVFAYNNLNPIPGTQWALLSNPAWLMPQSNSHNSNTIDWNINTQGIATLGGTQSNYNAGLRSANPGVFDLQTATFPTAPVPEPGSALLIGSIGMLGLLRRRRV
jgi:hypothetical protein